MKEVLMEVGFLNLLMDYDRDCQKNQIIFSALLSV